jgi:hypothetical protein
VREFQIQLFNKIWKRSYSYEIAVVVENGPNSRSANCILWIALVYYHACTLQSEAIRNFVLHVYGDLTIMFSDCFIIFISVTEVFVVHGSHCKDCEDAVLSVVTYLNLTGLCKCSIDLCSLPKEWSPGMTQYYENKIAECQKVIVLFTVNENCECEDSVKGKEGAERIGV